MYTPRNVPANVDEIPAFLSQELLNIVKAWLAPVKYVQFEVMHVPPAKFMEGMVAIADGTDWNPGSGAGMYRYQGGTWNFVG